MAECAFEDRILLNMVQMFKPALELFTEYILGGTRFVSSVRIFATVAVSIATSVGHIVLIIAITRKVAKDVLATLISRMALGSWVTVA